MTPDTVAAPAPPARRPAPPEGWSCADLANDLRRLGLDDGDIVLVHSSLRSLGYVEGGAATVIAALREVIGEQGTVVVPAQTANNCHPSRWKTTVGREVPRRSWRQIVEGMANNPFNPAMTPSVNMGRVAEAVRTSRGATRSDHPQTSFAALGPAAAKITDAHARDCHLGENSSLARLVELHAKILLLGVGYAVCTAFHLAEYRVPNPPRRDYECVVETEFGGEWFQYEDVDLYDGDFARLGTALEAQHRTLVSIGHVGSVVSRLLPMSAAVDFAVEWLADNRGSARRSPLARLAAVRRARRERRIGRSIRRLK